MAEFSQANPVFGVPACWLGFGKGIAGTMQNNIVVNGTYRKQDLTKVAEVSCIFFSGFAKGGKEDIKKWHMVCPVIGYDKIGHWEDVYHECYALMRKWAQEVTGNPYFSSEKSGQSDSVQTIAWQGETRTHCIQDVFL